MRSDTWQTIDGRMLGVNHRRTRYILPMADDRSAGSDATTAGIRVRFTVAFSPAHSQLEPDAPPHYVHIYTVTVTNDGPRGVTLVARHWVITDGTGHEEHVRGPGVVGLQPFLAQGQSFTYSSSAGLPTPAGTMHGEYLMEWEDGARFEAKIAPFALIVPTAIQ
jgi:ApaG protein